MEIRLVRPSDVEALRNLALKTIYEAFEHRNNPEDFEAYTSVAFSRQQLLSEINHPNSVFYFAIVDNEPVGYIKLNFRDAQAEFKEDDSVEVGRLYVLASQQGKRIGAQLLDFAFDKALEEKMQYVWVGSWEHNPDATRFYERNGFVAFGSHKFFVGNDEQTDILLKKVM